MAPLCSGLIISGTGLRFIWLLAFPAILLLTINAMNDVKRISNKVANCMDEVVNGTEEVNQAMSENAGLTMQLGNSSDKLGEEINCFKTAD